MSSKKHVQINTVCNASTGKIMWEIQYQARDAGYDTISLVGRRKVYDDLKCEKFGNLFSFWIHIIITTLSDKQGYGSYFTTRKLLKRLRAIKPDILHLHNLHGYYLHIPSLMRYLKEEYQGHIFWTMHDCWPFTGHCPYFVMAGCDRWQTKCHHCPKKKEYPVSWGVDGSTSNFEAKKTMFQGLDKLSIIVPSEWMRGLLKQSFMKEYPVHVVPNGIDLKVFYPRQSTGIFEKYHIPAANQAVLLGVAEYWSPRKGLDDFIRLSKVLPAQYRIVLVGVTKAEGKRLPGEIAWIERTDSKEELAQLYSEAAIFINPSLEESFSLVTIEAIACGTPAIVLDTSAVKELVNKNNGIVLSRHTPDDYLDAIVKLEGKKLSTARVSASANGYAKESAGKRVLELYENQSGIREDYETTIR